MEYVKSGMVLGLGTGSTAAFAVAKIGELLKVCIIGHSCWYVWDIVWSQGWRRFWLSFQGEYTSNISLWENCCRKESWRTLLECLLQRWIYILSSVADVLYIKTLCKGFSIIIIEIKVDAVCSYVINADFSENGRTSCGVGHPPLRFGWPSEGNYWNEVEKIKVNMFLKVLSELTWWTAFYGISKLSHQVCGLKGLRSPFEPHIF